MGEFGLMTLQPGWITSRQIEAARIAMTRHVKRGGKIWIRIFPDKPITKKPAETRMGTGKGGVEYYVAVVKPGRILYEMEGMTPEVATAPSSAGFASATAGCGVEGLQHLRTVQVDLGSWDATGVLFVEEILPVLQRYARAVVGEYPKVVLLVTLCDYLAVEDDYKCLLQLSPPYGGAAHDHLR